MLEKGGEIMDKSTPRDEEIRHLVEEIGMEPWAAERVLEDDDLWIVVPEQRFAFLDPQEDVRQWEFAYEFAYALTEGFNDSPVINDATNQLLWDLRDRAEEALRRARKRAGFDVEDEEEVRARQ
jgi:hypothetical protein